MNNNFTEQMMAFYNIAPMPKETKPAMAYVPFQQPAETYEAEEGMEAGTLFPELNKPFEGETIANMPAIEVSEEPMAF